MEVVVAAAVGGRFLLVSIVLVLCVDRHCDRLACVCIGFRHAPDHLVIYVGG